MALLFISHSSKDNELVKQYKNKIEEFGFQSTFLDIDEKDGIQINEKWEERLYKELIKSKIALCLVSKNWIESCWCQKEYSLAKTLNKETILVSIEEDPQHKKEVFQWIGEHIQQIDIADNPEAFEKVLKHIDELTRKVFDKPYAWDENKNPYPGLLPFTEDMAAVFYGREDETDAVIAELNDPKSLASVHALLIVGASGMGKSSLLQAGILPKLKTFEEYHKKWHILPTIRPGKDPLGKMLRLLINEAITDSEEAGEYYERLKEEIQGDQFEASIEKLFDRILLKYPDKKILLPIDQAEEFFTLSNKEEKELFFKLLSWIFEHRDTFYTIWTIRSDQIERFQTEASLDTIRKYHAPYLLTPIKEEHISTIIKYPAYKSDIVLEESLIERIRQDLKDSKALPLLAYTLNELTKDLFANNARQKPRVVKLDDYLALAKEGENPIYAIVERKIEALLSKPKRIDASLDKEELLEETKRLFLYHLIDIDIDGKPSKKIAIKGELSPLMCKVADAFVQERLLVSSSVQIGDGSDTTVPTYEIAHESIIHNWPQLQEWINEEKEFFIVRAQVRVAMREWQKADESKKADALLGGLLLEKAQKFLDKAWSETEKRYIQKSIDHAQKIDKRKRNFLIGSFTTISALAGFGYYEFFQARENAKEAEKKKQLALAEAKRANRNERRMKEELEKAEHNLGLVLLEKANLALKNKEIPKAQLFAYASLLKINKKYDSTYQNAHAKRIILSYKNYSIATIPKLYRSSSICVPPNSKYIVGVREDDFLYIIDTQNFEIIVDLWLHHFYHVTSIKCSYDGKIIASASNDKTIKLWDTKSFKEVTTLKGHQAGITSISFSPDGKKIASAACDGTIKVWSLMNLKIVKKLATMNYYLSRTNCFLNIQFSPDGKKIISTNNLNGIFIEWDAKSFKEVDRVKFHNYRTVYNLNYFPDGKCLISSDYEQVKIWSDKGRELITTEVFLPTSSSTYSSNGKRIVIGSNKKIRIFDSESLKQIYEFTAHKKYTTAIAYSPDCSIMVSGSFEGVLKVWNANDFKKIVVLDQHREYISSVSFSPDGKYILSGSWDWTIRIWNAKNYQPIATLKGHKGIVLSASYSPDGNTIVSGSGDNTIKLWDAKSFKEIATLSGHKNKVTSVSFSPDGKYILSASWDWTIRIWNAKNYQPIATLKGHKGIVLSASYSPDGNTIVSGSGDNTIKLWDAKSFKEIATLSGHKNKVTSVSFSPDGKYILSSSKDWFLKIWDIEDFAIIEDTKYVYKSIKKIEQFLQVKLDGVTLKDATIPPLSPKESYPKHHPFHWINDAENGDAEAMYQLGLIYDRDNENDKALEWYKKALKAGYKPAEERIAFLEKWMSEHPEKPNNS